MGRWNLNNYSKYLSRLFYLLWSINKTSYYLCFVHAQRGEVTLCCPQFTIMQHLAQWTPATQLLSSVQPRQQGGPTVCRLIKKFSESVEGEQISVHVSLGTLWILTIKLRDRLSPSPLHPENFFETQYLHPFCDISNVS